MSRKKKMDHDQAARSDIAARPEVTGEFNNAAIDAANSGHDARHDAGKNGGTKRHDAGNAAREREILAPDVLENAAGKVISNSVGELRELFGMKDDKDFTVLLSETLAAAFAGIRFMSGRPWIRFAFAGTALAIAIAPPAVAYMRKKNEKDDDGGSR